MKIVILGLSITSSWGNGHATTYRGLVRELSRRGHDVLFLERDVPWYAENRDLADPPYGTTHLYSSLPDLTSRFSKDVAAADLVITGSYVPEGIAVGEWVLGTARRLTAFYDIDTPVTFAALQRGTCEYLSAAQVARYRIYFSFTGGPILRTIESEWGSPCARALFCSVDPCQYYPEERPRRWSLGYLGTYSPDRQPKLDQLLCEAATELSNERFVVAGPLYPADIVWPENVERIEHLSPSNHRSFYNSQQITLNITRDDMVAAGHSPSVRLFEAAACGTAIISDNWEGLKDILHPGSEIILARDTTDVVNALLMSSDQLRAIGLAAREKILARHTSAHRAAELEAIVLKAASGHATFSAQSR